MNKLRRLCLVTFLLVGVSFGQASSAVLKGTSTLKGVSTILSGAGGGGGSPIFVNASSDTSGTGVTCLSPLSGTCGALATGAWHPLAGNHLVVVSVANDGTITHGCSDNATGGSNTYVRDGTSTDGSLVVITFFHIHIISNSGAGSLTITCEGAGRPAVHALEYANGTGDLDTASTGGTGGNAISGANNPSSTTSCAPAAFMPTTAATFLVDGMGSTTGGAITALTQTDASYTMRGTSCINGGTCFLSAFGSRGVASSASYADGWSWTSAVGPVACLNAAYK